MQLGLLKWLKCINCGNSELTCSSFKASDSREVEDGIIRCFCGASYPVIGGVPRILPATLSDIVREDHGWFFKQYEDNLRESGKNGNQNIVWNERQTSTIKRTAQSFGYEWSHYSRMLEQYKQNFKSYFEGYSADFFKNKVVLDAGCGTGRHSYYAAKYGAEVIGIDLSKAIDVAYRNNRTNTRAHFIQADLTNLPLRYESFDLVYSIGVLHHLPDPESGFRELLKFVKTGGRILIYVYHKLDEAPRWHRGLLAVVTAMRQVTTRTPRPLLKAFCTVVAASSYAGLITPARILKKSVRLQGIAENIPLHAYAEYPFYFIYTDTFDRFSVPLEQRYSRDQLLPWFTGNGLSDISILGGSGWRVSGTKMTPLINTRN
jgi:SAM-dependent methyltransferase